MKTPLTAGMFGHEFSPKSPRFDLRCGQLRHNERSHNGGWYNSKGEKLGWGDLDDRDLKAIADDLEPGEVFVVLSESASFWHFVDRVGIIGSMSKVKPTEQNPGLDYVADHAVIMITPGEIHLDVYSRRDFVRETMLASSKK